MSSGSKLDQIVKGAPPPGTSVPTVKSGTSTSKAAEPQPSISTSPLPSRDPPLAAFHSLPPQIYLNLLILEASLRSQYLTLRDRRRQNTFFLLLLAIWLAGFSYLLFLRPREDGSGVGGSVYWVVEMGEKVALMGGVVTGMLIWGTGQWERGVRWPRRWLGVANRGLRSINAKIVVIKGPWWKELFGHLAFLFPYATFFPSSGMSYNYGESGAVKSRADDEGDRSKQEDLSPGGDYIKLLLLPKPFSPDFRENWELYRLEYWDKENERRARIRQIIRKRERDLAKKRGGWLWWTGWRGRGKVVDSLTTDVEMSHHRSHSEKERKLRPASARSESNSRNTSRSSTPSTLDLEERPLSTRTRRESTTANASERRRKAKPAMGSNEHDQITKLTPVSRPA
ncbi:MAG: hypothetical protein Q9163_004055 [Psora crenata]